MYGWIDRLINVCGCGHRQIGGLRMAAHLIAGWKGDKKDHPACDIVHVQ